MAELSLLVNVANLLDMGIRCRKSISDLVRQYRDAPNELIALSNEVSDLNIVLTEIESTYNSLSAHAGGPQTRFATALAGQLATAKANLNKLDSLTRSLSTALPSGSVKFNNFAWLSKRNLAIKLKDSIRDTRSNITLLLGSTAVSRTARVEVGIDALNIATAQNQSNLLSTLNHQADLLSAQSRLSIDIGKASIQTTRESSAQINNVFRRNQTQTIQGLSQLSTRQAANSEALHRLVSMVSEIQHVVSITTNRRREGADVHAEDDIGLTPSSLAWTQILSCQGRPEYREQLKEQFPVHDVTEVLGLSHLHLVIVSCLPLDLETQLQKAWCRSQINARDSRGQTPPHWAALKGSDIDIGLLLHNGANPDAVDHAGRTPLHNVAKLKHNRSSCIRLLLVVGANVNVPSRLGGLRPLDLAMHILSDLMTVKLLLAAGAELNAPSRSGSCPLQTAAVANNVRGGNLCLAHGAAIDYVDDDGSSALEECICHLSYEFLELLLGKKASYVTVNKFGWTVLHTTACMGDIRIVEILTRFGLRGVDPEAKNKAGDTARQMLEKRIASPSGFPEAFDRLLESVREANEEDFVDAEEYLSG
ncbi:hypothetical protein MMC25_007899 [Agyrium rufum]|nr:hypothetical protein [Agyrium rufum]